MSTTGEPQVSVPQPAELVQQLGEENTVTFLDHLLQVRPDLGPLDSAKTKLILELALPTLSPAALTRLVQGLGRENAFSGWLREAAIKQLQLRLLVLMPPATLH